MKKRYPQGGYHNCQVVVLLMGTILESDGLISMAYLYQDKELIERHGIGVIIDNTYYKIGIGPDIGTTLNNNSKIIKITDDEVVFTFNLDNDMKKSV